MGLRALAKGLWGLGALGLWLGAILGIARFLGRILFIGLVRKVGICFLVKSKFIDYPSLGLWVVFFGQLKIFNKNSSKIPKNQKMTSEEDRNLKHLQ
jgi:hypothetical protein